MAKLPAAFAKDKSKIDGLQSWCRDCSNEACRLRYRSDPARYIAKSIAWQKQNPDAVREQRREYGKNKRKNEKWRSAIQNWAHADRVRLADWYLRNLLLAGTSMTASQVPNELIELKRDQLKNIRLMKQLLNQLDSKNGN